MRDRKTELLLEILTQQTNHWMLFAPALTVWGLAAGYERGAWVLLLLWAVCGILPMLYSCLRRRFHGYFKLLLSHLAAGVILPGALYIMGGSVTAFLAGVCAGGYLLQSLFIHAGRAGERTAPIHPALGILATGACVFLLRYQAVRGWELWYVVTLCGALGLYALTLYIRQYLEFLSINEKSAGYFPASEMFRSGFRMAFVFVAAGAGLSLFLVNLGSYGAWWIALKRGIQNMLRSLFHASPRETAPRAEIFQEPEFPAHSVSGPVGMEEPSLIWKILEFAAYTAVSCLLAFGLIVFLCRLIRFLREHFFHGGFRARKEEERMTEPDVREKCDIPPAPIKGLKLSEYLSPAQKIRRLYRKRILSSAIELTEGRPEKLCVLTARECGERLGEERMAEIYEQVRYSGEEATADTLRRMREALRHREDTSP